MKFAASLLHRFAAGDVRYVYATGSAAVLRLDDVSARILDDFAEAREPQAWLEGTEQEQRDDLRATLEEMVSMGLIRPLDETPVPTPELPPMPFPLATLVLNVTNKCNLSCTYCYEYGEDKITDEPVKEAPQRASMMSPETACSSVDFLIASSAQRQEVSITFFGGETLLNFGTIKAAVLYAEERAREAGKQISFALTTNATLLTDAVIDFLVEHRFGVNISIDGDRDTHDLHRTFKSGKGSYDVILPRIRALIERNRGGRPIGARVTLTAGSGGIRELYRHLTAEVGFATVGFAPVTSAPGRDYALSDDNYDVMLAEFRGLAEEYVELAAAGRQHGFSNLDDLLREIHQGINKAHPCGAGLGLLGVSTEGELGLCHRFVESGDHEVGDVENGVDAVKREGFLRAGHISTKIACHECFARPLCSGGCYHEAYVRYSDASKPNLHYCDWIRSWTDLGLVSYGRIMNANPEFFRRFDRDQDPAPVDRPDAEPTRRETVT